MSPPLVVVQLSDPHIGADWAPGDPAAALARAVASVRALELRPDAVLISGDLADAGISTEYARVRELVAALEAPIHVLPGNHDDRATLRSEFDLPGSAAEPVFYSVDLGQLLLVMLDSTIPGADAGALDGEQLEWLEQVLSASADQPTMIALHHPPLCTGVQAWDQIGLSDSGRTGLAGVVARHPQVRRIVAGHLHRTIVAELAGRPLLTVPSTYVQGRLNFGAPAFELADEPAGFAVHTVHDGTVVSHIQPLI